MARSKDGERRGGSRKKVRKGGRKAGINPDWARRGSRKTRRKGGGMGRRKEGGRRMKVRETKRRQLQDVFRGEGD